MKPPRFITFEGIDGSGKSTQARRFADHLRDKGHDVVLTREPGGSPGAEEIRQLVLTGDPDRWSAETEILLFTASRRDHLEKTIDPALAAGKMVISDRFADSTRIYQGATRGDLRHMVDQLHTLMIKREPDLTFIIDMEPKIALSRSLGRLRTTPHSNALLGVSETENPQSSQNALRGPPSDPGQNALSNLGKKEETKNALSTTAQSEHRNALAGHLLPEDRFEDFGLPFQETLRHGFLALAHANPGRCVLIDGNRTEDQIASEIAAYL